MYFAKLSIIAMLAAVAAAQGESKCSVGELKCCQHVQQADNATAQKLAGPLGLAGGALNVLLGANCTPISGAIGLSGNNCNGSPVCCKDVHANGLLTVACVSANGNA